MRPSQEKKIREMECYITLLIAEEEEESKLSQLAVSN